MDGVGWTCSNGEMKIINSLGEKKNLPPWLGRGIFSKNSARRKVAGVCANIVWLMRTPYRSQSALAKGRCYFWYIRPPTGCRMSTMSRTTSDISNTRHSCLHVWEKQKRGKKKMKRLDGSTHLQHNSLLTIRIVYFGGNYCQLVVPSGITFFSASNSKDKKKKVKGSVKGNTAGPPFIHVPTALLAGCNRTASIPRADIISHNV